MAGLAAFRCTSCFEIVLVSDRGKIRAVGEARLIGTDHDGSPEVRCICGTISTWSKQPVSP